MKIELKTVGLIVRERLEGQVNLKDFDLFWEDLMNRSEDMKYQWVAEGMLNSYLRWLELGEKITKN